MTYVNFRILSSGGKYTIGNMADPYADLSAYVAFEGDTNTLRFFGGGYLSVDMAVGASGNAVYGGVVGRLSVYDEGVANRFFGGDAENYAYLRGVGASVTFRDGNNGLTDYGSKTSFKLGHGDNNLWLNGQRGVGVVGDGDNEVTFVEQSLSYRLTLGDGNNTVDLNGVSSKVTVGGGANRFRSGEESKGNTIVAGDGNNTFDLRGVSHTVFTGHGDIYANVASSNTKLTIGNGEYNVFATSGGLNLVAGIGHGYVSLGAPGAKVNVGGTATVWGSASADTIVVRGNGTYDKHTYINAGAGNDTVIAGDYAEVIGGAGADKLTVGKNGKVDGGAGNDVISAGAGANINGGAGADTISFIGGQVMGGAGADVFIPQAGSGYAWTDFGAGDVLDLSKLVAAMDVGTFMGAGVYGNTLQIEITSGGETLTISLGNVGDNITDADGFGGAVGAGVIIGAPNVTMPLTDFGKG